MITPVEKPVREADYHSRIEISRSDLAMFRESRRNFRAVKDKRIPWRDEEKFADALDIGTATHLLSLEPERFASEVVVWDGAVRAGAAWKRFKRKADENKQIILKDADWWMVAVAHAALQNRMTKIIDHPSAFREETIVWDHTLPNGEVVNLRCRLDLGIAVPSESGWVFDIKTMADVEPRKVRSDMRQRAYWLQDAHYTEAVMHRWGLEFDQTRFFFLAIGKGVCKRIANQIKDDNNEYGPEQLAKCKEAVQGLEPLMTSMVELSYEQRLKAREKWNQLLMEYVECVRTGDWSDPGEDEVQVIDNVVE